MIDNCAIVVKNLSRTFEPTKKKVPFVAVDDISFTIDKGTIFGLLGPNGAGKSTVIKILSTQLLPSAGTVKVFGMDVCKNTKPLRKIINLINGGESGLYPALTGVENLRLFATLYQLSKRNAIQKIEELLALVDLPPGSASRRVATYSKGMKQRLHIAKGLINDPEIIFMDEPSLGLDPEAALSFRQIVRKLQASGKTIVLTTHYMQEAEELCDKIAIINHGKIITGGTVGDLSVQISASDYSVVLLECLTEEAHGILYYLRKFENVFTVNVAHYRGRTDVISFRFLGEHHALINFLHGAPTTKINKLDVRRPSLEDVYLDALNSSKRIAG